MKTPSSLSIDSRLSTISWMSSMCANTFAAVTMLAAPNWRRTSSALSRPKKALTTRMLAANASLWALVGSTPQTRCPPF